MSTDKTRERAKVLPPSFTETDKYGRRKGGFDRYHIDEELATGIKVTALHFYHFGDGAANTPGLYLTLDCETTDFKDSVRFEHVAGEVFVGSFGEYRELWWHNGSNRNAGGMYGDVYTITMKDGSDQKIAGPWVGSSANVWKRHGGEKIIECAYYSPRFKNTGIARSVTVDFIESVFKKNSIPYEILEGEYSFELAYSMEVPA